VDWSAIKTLATRDGECLVAPEGLGHRMGSRGEYLAVSHEGKRWLAHRLAYIEAYGPLPAGKPFVCHMCNNPRCFEATHLYAGSGKDNARDREQRWGGAWPAWRERHQRLDADCARVIRAAYSAGASQRLLASVFGVSQRAIWQIVNNKTWVDAVIETTPNWEQRRWSSRT
jgi:hypothetical protein